MRKDVLDYLQQDRRADDKFLGRLKEAGFVIKYGRYSYWDGQEYIELGDARVWLVDTGYKGNTQYVQYRKRNLIVAELRATIDEQYELMQRQDAEVENFFKLLHQDNKKGTVIN